MVVLSQTSHSLNFFLFPFLVVSPIHSFADFHNQDACFFSTSIDQSKFAYVI